MKRIPKFLSSLVRRDNLRLVALENETLKLKVQSLLIKIDKLENVILVNGTLKSENQSLMKRYANLESKSRAKEIQSNSTEADQKEKERKLAKELTAAEKRVNKLSEDIKSVNEELSAEKRKHVKQLKEIEEMYHQRMEDKGLLQSIEKERNRRKTMEERNYMAIKSELEELRRRLKDSDVTNVNMHMLNNRKDAQVEVLKNDIAKLERKIEAGQRKMDKLREEKKEIRKTASAEKRELDKRIRMLEKE